jgi:hypothetical protein
MNCLASADPLGQSEESNAVPVVLLSTGRVDVLVDDVREKVDDTRLNLSKADKNPAVTLEETISFFRKIKSS